MDAGPGDRCWSAESRASSVSLDRGSKPESLQASMVVISIVIKRGPPRACRPPLRNKVLQSKSSHMNRSDRVLCLALEQRMAVQSKQQMVPRQALRLAFPLF